MRLVYPESGRGASSLHKSNKPKRPSRRDRRQVEQANQEAALLSHDDLRWVFATRVATKLEGGRAGILRPEVREKLLSQGQSMGLRPFDANLVIAIVQDAARTGDHPLSADVTGRLRLIRDPNVSSKAPIWPLICSAVALGAAVFFVLKTWLGG